MNIYQCKECTAVFEHMPELCENCEESAAFHTVSLDSAHNPTDKRVPLQVYIMRDQLFLSKEKAYQLCDGMDYPTAYVIIVEAGETVADMDSADRPLYADYKDAGEDL